MTKAGEREVVKAEHVGGGAGFIMKEALLSGEELGRYCRMFSKVTETETYYILSGKGMYDDNGKAIPAEPGDVFYCKDGDGHGMKNTGTEDLIFIALILK